MTCVGEVVSRLTLAWRHPHSRYHFGWTSLPPFTKAHRHSHLQRRYFSCAQAMAGYAAAWEAEWRPCSNVCKSVCIASSTVTTFS